MIEQKLKTQDSKTTYMVVGGISTILIVAILLVVFYNKSTTTPNATTLKTPNVQKDWEKYKNSWIDQFHAYYVHLDDTHFSATAEIAPSEATKFFDKNAINTEINKLSESIKNDAFKRNEIIHPLLKKQAQEAGDFMIQHYKKMIYIPKPIQ